ncbi:hypothetical protein GF1_11870 [Desulfolithobacter dissulfuricans]|uniref:Uncharacterized protein n=1 Tax=Desulfolithobacter dissulfuricans TaxID=2795293 RepID=A0A915U9C7_9BACT|nr:hypothetical protein GF1_11870 [Desulfolithobacter dissulfuricans]
MKLKIEGYKPESQPWVQWMVLTRDCPFPYHARGPGRPVKVGSFACHGCESHKGATDEYVYCAAGDKRSGRKKKPELEIGMVGTDGNCLCCGGTGICTNIDGVEEACLTCNGRGS